VAVGALLIGAVVALVRWPPAGFLAAWFFLALAPTSSLVPIATEVGAERRMYLPLMAIVAYVVVAMYRLCLARRITSSALAMAAVASAAVALTAATVARHREYASALTLAQTALARWPSPTAHAMVGGELAALGRDAEAVSELRLAAAVEPRARFNLGITLFNLSDYQGAARELEALAREHPEREEIPEARRLLGSAYSRQQKWPEAVVQYRSVLSMVPSDQAAKRLLVAMLTNQGAALARAKQFADAIATLRQALALDRNDVLARHTLAMALYDAGDFSGAVAEARATLDVDSGHAASHDLIGRGLALQGRYDEAVDALTQAARLSPDDGQIQDDLRQALAARSESRRVRPGVR
jgi:tetratricopeptide (TPR) repeat protein